MTPKILLKELREKSRSFLCGMYEGLGDDICTDYKLKNSVAKALKLNDSKWGNPGYDQNNVSNDWDRDSEEY
jgi:hypothetical protein